jgi:hypothetical protein
VTDRTWLQAKQSSLGENHYSWWKKLARKSQRAVKISKWLKIRELQPQLYDSAKQSGLGKPCSSSGLPGVNGRVEDSCAKRFIAIQIFYLNSNFLQ